MHNLTRSWLIGWVRLTWVGLALLLVSCAADDPLAELKAEVAALADNLDNKRSAAVLAQLHPSFHAQDGQFDRAWAQRTMTLLYLRHKNVHVLPLAVDSQLTGAERGTTQAQVTLAGAEQLLPNAAASYRVRLEWWRDDGRWQLARLSWE
ncbi:hypothetical protein [Atopomonas sediminilitoris]|uniref:hypothetical protein n=1 Tax=Atopomonas sediminilitoris TaxID=2919919 RepID=UPI001F4E3D08|nr:hypothetical protein [Atopomonas sediminilitoris]MCJ8169579.1 hypothetical protein [Atopomonas sediminilitoris]